MGSCTSSPTSREGPIFKIEVFENLKASVHEDITTGHVFLTQHLQATMFGKFLGKALPLEQVKLALSDMW